MGGVVGMAVPAAHMVVFSTYFRIGVKFSLINLVSGFFGDDQAFGETVWFIALTE